MLRPIGGEGSLPGAAPLIAVGVLLTILMAAATSVAEPETASSLTRWIETAGSYIEAGGVLVIVAGVAVTTGLFLFNLRSQGTSLAYSAYRKGLARSILLGLELLVAGDIIRTVVVAPTLTNVLILGVIVLIRTFLSFTLEMEVTGKWPWRRSGESGDPGERAT